ncbi:MAG: guanosine monophosphate reductase [Bdellovibrionaceae bacterium]|nr:guanosine monophosphate reductase [Pseudobdellovibrionaceae bacterium]MBX3034804.1 guanosine monophosphate reductase [Pseudobdellovibrionaceae bacterium]
MNLFFPWKEIPLRPKGLTFDDVLIVPGRSDVRSRRDPELTSKVTRKHRLKLPVLSANMDTITECEMMIAMHQLGGLGILHRFIDAAEQVRQIGKAREAGVTLISASVGVTTDERARAEALVKAGAQILTIDIAHGHSVQMLEMMKWIKDRFPQVEIIAGNMATPDAAEELIEAGADAIKVGIGPGSMCTTRIITGCGVPQLTAIALCAQVARPKGVPVIADGGLRTSGDIVKALAAGADVVMLGGMLSGTIETPGEIKNGRKMYRGMASRAAQDSWRGGVPEGMAPEGESTSVAIKGHVKDVLSELAGGLRSGMSYINATSIDEIREKARFIEMSASGIGESHAHGART